MWWFHVSNIVKLASECGVRFPFYVIPMMHPRYNACMYMQRPLNSKKDAKNHIKNNDTSNNDEMVTTKTTKVTQHPLITSYETDTNDDYGKKVRRLNMHQIKSTNDTRVNRTTTSTPKAIITRRHHNCCVKTNGTKLKPTITERTCNKKCQRTQHLSQQRHQIKQHKTKTNDYGKNS